MARDRIKSLRRVRAGDLIPNPRNWRRHPPAQIQAMRAALSEIGYADALLVRETKKGLQLIDGHLRAGIEPEQKVPVLVLDVTAKEADKLLATLDPLAGMAELDVEALTALSGVIEFEAPELEEVVLGVVGGPKVKDGLTDPDAVPEPPDEPVTRPGDLWLLGDHRLLCGDAGSAEDVERLLDGATVHLVNTDPPYNVRVEPRSNNAIAAGLSSFAAPKAKHHQKFHWYHLRQAGVRSALHLLPGAIGFAAPTCERERPKRSGCRRKGRCAHRGRGVSRLRPGHSVSAQHQNRA